MGIDQPFAGFSRCHEVNIFKTIVLLIVTDSFKQEGIFDSIAFGGHITHDLFIGNIKHFLFHRGRIHRDLSLIVHHFYKLFGNEHVIAQQIQLIDLIYASALQFKLALTGNLLMEQNIKNVTAKNLGCFAVAQDLKLQMYPGQRQKLVVGHDLGDLGLISFEHIAVADLHLCRQLFTPKMMIHDLLRPQQQADNDQYD